MENSTSYDIADRKLLVMKKIARLDMKKLSATCPKEIGQMNAERAHLKSQQKKLSHESYCHHHRICHSKKIEYNEWYKALESNSKLNIDELKIVDMLSTKIQRAYCSDLPDQYAQASNELEALFHRNGLHDQWVIISRLNSEISFHAIKTCEADEEDDAKSVSSEVRLMVEEEDDIPSDPEGCNSEAKSVEGVDGKDSVWSSIGPPASSPKRSNGRGRKPPKKRNGTKNRNYLGLTQRNNNRANTKKANNIDAGSRIIMHSMPPVPEEVPNSRRCLLYALLAIIKDPVIKDALTCTFLANMPPKGDTPISVAINALAFHKMALVRATHKFNQGCYAFNLLQIRPICRIIVIVRLWDLKCPKWYTDHCVAWDGSIVHDHPKSVVVNNSSDRSSSLRSKAVFERIFHKKEYHRWQITNIYELIG